MCEIYASLDTAGAVWSSFTQGMCAGGGAPVLWVQRRRMPLLSPPTSGLRFDVMEKYPHDGP